MQYTLQYTAGGKSAERVAREAMQRHSRSLHAVLLKWLRVHPDPLDPTVIIAAGEGQPGLCDVGPRSDLLSYLRSYLRLKANPMIREIVEVLSQRPSVPLGSIDVIVSTPEAMALLQATPRPQGLSWARIAASRTIRVVRGRS